jgi:hypothetical protein
MSQWPFFALGFVVGLLVGEATLVFFLGLVRQGEDPNSRLFTTSSARTRRPAREQVLPLRDEAEGNAAAG